TANCSKKSCSCLQDVISNVGQCTCFPSSSSCISNSKLPISITAIPSISAITKGSCESQISPCSSNGICLQISSSHFLCQCNPDYTGVLCQTAIFSPD
ncbi:unnamed protein product, partial [Rotaria magnacalcarata]